MYKKSFKKVKFGDYLYISSSHMYSEDIDIKFIKSKVLSVQYIDNLILRIELDEFSFDVNNPNDTNIVISRGDYEYSIYTSNNECVAKTRNWLKLCIENYKEKIQRLEKLSHEIIGNLEPFC